ncbi:unnamed protein product, partial [Didymodactylos carnosus]
IKLDSTSQLEIEHYCKDVIIQNEHRILSLYFEDEPVINDFLTHCIIDLSFDRLESIVLDEVSLDRLVILFFYLKSLPRLVSLTIYIENKWSCDDDGKELDAFVVLASNERFSTIEYLNIDHKCIFNELFSILQHTPQLRHLIHKNLIKSNTNIDFQKLVALPNLIYLRIDNCEIGFDEFEIFITKLYAQLQILNIEQHLCDGCLDAD